MTDPVSNQTAPVTGIDSMRDFMDLDADGKTTIDHPFAGYHTDASNHFCANGTNFLHPVFDHPATTSFKTVEHAQNACFGNAHFIGIEEGETLTLGTGNANSRERFYNMSFENINGGKIHINDYAVVNGMDVSQVTLAHLQIGSRAQVNDLDAQGARIITLQAGNGAQIVRGNFRDTTIDMASQLEGTVWRNCEFVGSNLRDVNMCGAQLSDVSFVRTDMAGVNFSGPPPARLSNMSFVDVDISRINASGAHFHNVIVNGRTINSATQFEGLQRAEAIRLAMAPTMSSVQQGPAPAASLQDISLAAAGVSNAQQISLSQQQATGAGATPAEAMPVPQQGASLPPL